jgi:hypothetical protein
MECGSQRSATPLSETRKKVASLRAFPRRPNFPGFRCRATKSIELDKGVHSREMQLDILFLDIDGVLNPDKAKGRADFAPECVAELKRFFAARPETKVVFSTSWRLGFPFFVLGWLWHHHHLPLQAVVGRTPVIAEDQRGQEVRKWLRDAPALHPGCKIRRYAALDDEIEPLMGWLPRRNLFRCDSSDGLTPEITDQLIQHFSNEFGPKP